MPRMKDYEYIEPILRYLEENGPSDVMKMKSDGLDFPPGLVMRMHMNGYIRKVGSVKRSNGRPAWVWGLV